MPFIVPLQNQSSFTDKERIFSGIDIYLSCGLVEKVNMRSMEIKNTLAGHGLEPAMMNGKQCRKKINPLLMQSGQLLKFSPANMHNSFCRALEASE